MTQRIDDERVLNEKQSPEHFKFNSVKKQLRPLLSEVSGFGAEDNLVSQIDFGTDSIARTQSGGQDSGVRSSR